MGSYISCIPWYISDQHQVYLKYIRLFGASLCHLIVFCIVKKMSMVTSVMSPMLTSPELSVSGLNITQQSLHCLVNTSISNMCSVLISKHRSSPDLLLFLVIGERKESHKVHLSITGLQVLDHPSEVKVSLALHLLITLRMLLSGNFSFLSNFSLKS